MKIGCLLDSLSTRGGGVAESVRRLTESLTTRNGEFQAFGLEDSSVTADIAQWQPVPVQTFCSEGPRAWGYSSRLLPALLDAKLDVLLTHGLWKYCSIASRKWHRRTGRPYIVHPHGMLESWALQNSKWKKRVAALLYEDRHLRDAGCLRALCDAEAQSIRHYGLRNPVCVIPNGVDLPDLERKRDRPWRETAPNGKILLYLGRLHPKKNLVPLLEAWAEAKHDADHHEWSLVIVGWDEKGHQGVLRRRARELRIESTVRFSEALFGEERDAAYQNADAFVLPSLSEGLPMVILEAWAFAKAVLMTVQCNLPEGFAAKAAVKIGTASESIAEGLRQLFQMNDSERIAMGERGRRLVSEHFSWQKIGEEMYRVCNWVTGGGPPSSSVRFN
jgi:glycosyltransferase involved in cell wall biosynthesis